VSNRTIILVSVEAMLIRIFAQDHHQRGRKTEVYPPVAAKM